MNGNSSRCTSSSDDELPPRWAPLSLFVSSDDLVAIEMKFQTLFEKVMEWNRTRERGRRFDLSLGVCILLSAVVQIFCALFALKVNCYLMADKNHRCPIPLHRLGGSCHLLPFRSLPVIYGSPMMANRNYDRSQKKDEKMAKRK